MCDYNFEKNSDINTQPPSILYSGENCKDSDKQLKVYPATESVYYRYDPNNLSNMEIITTSDIINEDLKYYKFCNDDDKENGRCFIPYSDYELYSTYNSWNKFNLWVPRMSANPGLGMKNPIFDRAMLPTQKYQSIFGKLGDKIRNFMSDPKFTGEDKDVIEPDHIEDPDWSLYLDDNRYYNLANVQWNNSEHHLADGKNVDVYTEIDGVKVAPNHYIDLFRYPLYGILGSTDDNLTYDDKKEANEVLNIDEDTGRYKNRKFVRIIGQANKGVIDNDAESTRYRIKENDNNMIRDQGINPIVFSSLTKDKIDDYGWKSLRVGEIMPWQTFIKHCALGDLDKNICGKYSRPDTDKQNIVPADDFMQIYCANSNNDPDNEYCGIIRFEDEFTDDTDLRGACLYPPTLTGDKNQYPSYGYRTAKPCQQNIQECSNNIYVSGRGSTNIGSVNEIVNCSQNNDPDGKGINFRPDQSYFKYNDKSKIWESNDPDEYIACYSENGITACYPGNCDNGNCNKIYDKKYPNNDSENDSSNDSSNGSSNGSGSSSGSKSDDDFDHWGAVILLIFLGIIFLIVLAVIIGLAFKPKSTSEKNEFSSYN